MHKNDLVIEVISGHDRPEKRETRGDNPREFYTQTAYAHTGDAFPVRIQLSFDELSQCLTVGKYRLVNSSFRANQYGSLEIDRFNMQFELLESAK